MNLEWIWVKKVSDKEPFLYESVGKASHGVVRIGQPNKALMAYAEWYSNGC